MKIKKTDMRKISFISIFALLIMPINRVMAMDYVWPVWELVKNNPISTIQTGKMTYDVCNWIFTSKDEQREQNRLNQKEMYGHEHYQGFFTPFRVKPGNFRYGAGDIYEQSLATKNVHRLCGDGKRPWCEFRVNNDNVALDPTDGKVKDPVQGTTKTLLGSYSCVSGINGRVISTHQVRVGEYEDAFFSCVDKDITIFK